MDDLLSLATMERALFPVGPCGYQSAYLFLMDDFISCLRAQLDLLWQWYRRTGSPLIAFASINRIIHQPRC